MATEPKLIQRRQTAIRKQQIINAARKVIVKYGSEHVTVRKIAKEVGISEAAIYRHFKSKKDILSFLIDNIEDALLKDVSSSGPDQHSFLESLNSVLENHLLQIKERQGSSFQVIAEIVSLGDKKLNRKAASTINKYISHLKELLAKCIQSGEAREDVDLEAAATLLFGMMQGLVNIWALNGYSFDLEEKYIPLWQTFRRAIVKQ